MVSVKQGSTVILPKCTLQQIFNNVVMCTPAKQNILWSNSHPHIDSIPVSRVTMESNSARIPSTARAICHGNGGTRETNGEPRTHLIINIQECVGTGVGT